MIPSLPDHPANATRVVAGLGCRRDCPPGELLNLLLHSLERQGLSVDNLVALASIDHKRDEAGLLALAEHLGLALVFFSPWELAPYRKSASGSALTQAVTGSPAVAEPCALALAARLGTAARPLGEKNRNASATCALASFDGEPPA